MEIIIRTNGITVNCILRRTKSGPTAFICDLNNSCIGCIDFFKYRLKFIETNVIGRNVYEIIKRSDSSDK